MILVGYADFNIPVHIGNYIFAEDIIDFRLKYPYVYALSDRTLFQFDLISNQTVHSVQNNDFTGKKIEMIKDDLIIVYSPFSQIYKHYWTYRVAKILPIENKTCPKGYKFVEEKCVE